MARSRRPSERSTSWSVDGIRIEINDTKLLIAAKKGMRPELVKILGRIKRQARILTSNLEYSKPSKRLMHSIQKSKVKDLNQSAVYGTVSAGSARAPYARYVHNGTRPHVIYARPENKSGMLRFHWAKRMTIVNPGYRKQKPGLGDDIYATHAAPVFRLNPGEFIGPMVGHPGNRPNPFLVKAAAAVTGYRAVRRG